MFVCNYDRKKFVVDYRQKYVETSEVPVEHETLKSGRDVTGCDGRRRWKDRREGWNIFVDIANSILDKSTFMISFRALIAVIEKHADSW